MHKGFHEARLINYCVQKYAILSRHVRDFVIRVYTSGKGITKSNTQRLHADVV